MTERARRHRGVLARAAVVGVVAAAVSAGCGQSVASGPLELTTESALIDATCMAWDGEGYSVVWVSHTGGPGTIFFARVSPAGDLLQQPTALFQGLDESVESCQLLLAGDHFKLLFEEGDVDAELFRFTTSGAILSTPSEIVDQPYYWTADLRGDEYTILATDYYSSDYHLFLVSEQDPWTHLELATGLSIDDPVMRWLPEENVYLALWERSGDIELARIPAADPLLFTAVALVDTGNFQYGPLQMTASPSGAVFAAWLERDRMQFMRASTDGALMWPEPRALLPERRESEASLDLAAFGDEALAVWQSDHETSLQQIYAGRVPSSAPTEIVEPVMLSNGLFSFRDPHVVVGDGTAAVIFEGSVAGSERLYWTPFPLDGAL